MLPTPSSNFQPITSEVNTTQKHTKPRRYQLELFERAKKENVAIVLDTGTGKTMVAILLMDYILNETKHDNKQLVFIAENRILVNQQAEHIRKTLTHLEFERLEKKDEQSIKHISEEINEMVGCYVGDSGLLNKLRSNSDLKKKKVIVSTAAFLLNLLSHNILQMESISLLIIDECHHCGDGDHPYKVIMSQFYHSISQIEKRPKIFGMTASAIRSLKEDKAIAQKQKLEAYLDCKLTTFSSGDELYEELREHTNLPNEIVVTYESADYTDSKKLDNLIDFSTEIIETLTKFTPIQPKDMMSYSKILFNDFNYVLENLGTWGVKEYLNTIFDHIEGMKNDNEKPTINELVSFSAESTYKLMKSQSIELQMTESLRISLTSKMDKIFPKSSISKKLQLLEEVVEEHLFKKNDGQMRCLVFCERRYTAILLSRYFSRKLACDFIIGHNALSSRSKFGFKKNTGFEQKTKAEKFRSGDLKCLFCTNVVEEGFDVPACNLVIRFDKFTDFLRAYIQSRGRARKQDSTFIMMVDSKDKPQQNLCENGKILQEKMLSRILHNSSPQEQLVENDILTFETPSKAKLTLNNSVRLYNQYCAVFPSQSADEKKPKFSIYGEDGLFVTEITFPTHCPVPVASISNNHEDDPVQYRYNKLISKRYCAFKAIKLLHKYSELDDHLFPRYSTKHSSISSNLAPPASMATILPQTEIFDWRKKKLTSITTDNSHNICIYDICLDGDPTEFQFIFHNEVDTDFEELGLFHFRMNGGRNISIKRVESTTVGNDYIVECFKYHDFMFRQVSKIAIQEEKSKNYKDWLFFIIPKHSREHFTGVPVLKILEQNGKDSENILKNMILETIYNHRVYLLQGIEYDKTPNSPFDTHEYKDYKTYYKEKWGLEIEHPNQPLLRAYQPKFSTLGSSSEHQNIFLVPEFITACSFNIEMLRFLKMAPEFLYRFINRLVTAQFAKRFLLFQPIVDETLTEDGKTLEAFELLEEALTAKRSQVGSNYEKLEFYGDSVLKLIFTKHLYQEFPLATSGSLSQLQHKFVSNSFLAYAARNTKLPLFIITEPLNTSLLLQNVGGFKSTRFADETNLDTQYKVLADVVESVIGFCYHVFKGSFTQIDVFLDSIGITKPKGDNPNDPGLKRLALEQIYHEKISNHVVKIENKLNYQFGDKLLLTEALIHSSFNSVFNYERLEFLGDAVLGLIVTSRIFNEFHKNAGFTLGMMSKLREKIVKNSTFARLCTANEFHNYIVFMGNQIATQITTSSSKDDNEYVKILSDVFESIAGALFVESNYDLGTVQIIYDLFLWEKEMNEIFTEANKSTIGRFISHIPEVRPENPIVLFISNNSDRDASSVLNELLQQFVFNRLERSDSWFQEIPKKPNPPHDMIAEFLIVMFGMKFNGTGTSIKLAKKQASMECLQYLLQNSEDFLKLVDNQLSN